MSRLTKQVNDFQLFLQNTPILDVSEGSEYASGLVKLLCCDSMALKGISGKTDICQNDYSIPSKFEFSPYLEIIHESTTFKLKKV